MLRTLVAVALASLLFVAVGCPQKQPTVDSTTPPPPKAAPETFTPMTTDNTGTGPGAVTPYDSSSGYTAPKTGTDVKPTTPKSSSKTYIVQAHDTIYGIARTQLGNGSRAKDIIALNPGIDKDHIKPGQVLNMPEK